MAAWAGRAAVEVAGQGVAGCSFDPLVNAAPDEYGVVLGSIM